MSRAERPVPGTPHPGDPAKLMARSPWRFRTRRRIGGAALLLALVATLAVTWFSSGSIKTLAEARSARRAVASGRYAEAIAPLERWSRARPKDPEPRFLKARVALALERPQDAVVELERARALGHPAPPLDRLRGILLARAGHHDEAEPLLLQARDGSATPDGEVEEALARIYLETYRFGPALSSLDRWTRAAPDDPKPYLWRAEVDLRTNAGNAALIRDYREALRRDPGLDRARLGLAGALRRESRLAEATEEFTAYLARHPDDPDGHVGAGRCALEAGDERTALQHFERALALAPDHVDALAERAGIALQLGDADAALELVDRALRMAGDDPELHYRRSLALTRLGRHDEAQRERQAVQRLKDEHQHMSRIREALLSAPSDVHLQIEAARWLIAHGHEQEGLHWARKVLRERPGDPEAAHLMAEHYARQGDLGLANFYRVQAATVATPP